MRRDEAKSLLDGAIAAAGGEEVEIILGGGTAALTRFANNEITQNVAERRYVLSVRIVQGKRTGRATGNDLSRAGIKRLIDQASAATRLQPEIADLLPLPGKQEHREIDALDPGTETLGPEARASEVGHAVGRCRKAGLAGAGIYEVRSGTIGDYGEISPLAIANSRGLFAYHAGTSAAFRVSALDGAASGWAGHESHRAQDIDGDALSGLAVEKAIRSRDPKSWEPGRYTVVLEPAAVADLIQDMAWISFGALLVQEGRSFLSGKIGEKVMGENITLRDDPFHPLHRGAPFDAEGMPTVPTTIIDHGVAKSAVYDRQTAAKEGRESTGHGLPVPNTYGPLARHLVLEGSQGSVADLIGRVDRGLLVTRVWYTNVVDPKSVTLTGMTRDGLFAIEKGKVTHGVRNFRFNQSVIQMLRDVEAMSAAVRSGGVVCPGILAHGFQMSSATQF
ncbi:MAG TPA: TldD/PmbA family protein [Candidatus Limnocylindrales bacterium]|nr:TldD/PmbA family protein [Candidatus Limnocylindrales bacterium]